MGRPSNLFKEVKNARERGTLLGQGGRFFLGEVKMLEGEFDDERNDGDRMLLQSQSLYDFCL